MKHKLSFTLISVILCFNQALHAQQSITWTDIQDVSISGNDITKTGAAGWTTGGAFSTEWIDFVTDGHVSAKAGELNTTKAFGLSTHNQEAGINGITFAIYLSNDNKVFIYEDGLNRNSTNITYTTADVFEVVRFGLNIQYKRNGTIIHTSTVESTSRLYADVKLNHNGASLNQVTVSNDFEIPAGTNINPSAAGVTQTVDWADINNMGFIDSKIVKIGASGFGNGGLASSKRLDFHTNGWVKAYAYETNQSKMFGLSDTNLDAGYNSIDYAINLSSDGKIYIYENGLNRLSTGISYNPGDDFIVEREGSQIKYKYNDNVIYTSQVKSSSRLVADFAFNGQGGSLNQVSISASFKAPGATNSDPNGAGVTQTVNWNDIDNLGFIGTKIIKTSATGWGTGGAASTNRLDFISDGSIEVTVAETHTSKAFGLSDQNLDAGLSTIDYAILLSSDGIIYVYENGINRNTTGITYATGKKVSIERMGSQVFYKYDGQTIHTSSVKSNTRLVADIAFNTQGASLDQVTITNSFNTPQTATNTDPSGAGVIQNVEWTGVDNLGFVGTRIVKTSSTGWGTGGAASLNRLDFISDGFIEVTVAETHTSKAFGLSDQNTDATLNTIDYAILLSSNGTIYIYENGINRNTTGITYTTGKKVSVERMGSQVFYKYDGQTIHTSSVKSNTRLIGDIALYTQGSSLDQVTISNSFTSPQTATNTDPSGPGVTQTLEWTDIDNLGFVGTRIVKTSDTGWGTGGAASTKQLDLITDGSIEVTIAETHTSKAFGLSDQNLDAGLSTIDYSILLSSNGTVYVYENGTNRNTTGIAYAPGKKASVERFGSQIIYKYDGQTIHTSSISSNIKLVADIALYTQGSSLDEVTISNSFTSTQTPVNSDPDAAGVIQTVDWQDIDHLGFVGSRIVKTGTDGWESGGAASVERLDYSSNGWVEATIAETHTSKIIGLSDQNMDAGINTIDYGILLSSNGIIYIYENGINRNTTGIVYQTGEKIRIEREEAVVRYLYRDNVIHTSSIQSFSRLIADFSLHQVGATFDVITVSDSFTAPQLTNTDPDAAGVQQSVDWKGISGIGFVGNKIVKTTTSGYGNSGASSVKKLPIATNGWVEATVRESSTSKLFGLSEQSISNDYAEINYAILLNSNKLIYIVENGTTKLSTGITYKDDDELRVERMGFEIKYFHNNQLLYTSTIASTSILEADFTFNTEGATLSDIHISDSFVNSPTNNPDQNAAGVIQNVNWTDIDNISFVGSKMIKTESSGWGTGAAAATDFLEAGTDGFASTVVTEKSTARMFGLSEVNTDNSYASTDYGIYLVNNGTLNIYENGIKKSIGTVNYGIGDVLKVERQGQIIYYMKNDDIFYTSLVPSTSRLIIDLAFYSELASLDQITLSESSTTVPNPGQGGGHWLKDGSTIYSLENVAIGQDSPYTDHMLSVNGEIVTKGVLVTLQGWADYVFGDEYNLQSLDELKAFIKKNKHLPGIPSETEVVKDGVQLEDMAVMQMQKIEELTLYLLQQDALIKSQNEKLEAIERQLKALIKK